MMKLNSIEGPFYLFSMVCVPRPPGTRTACAPAPRGISFVWQTWKQTQLISYQSNFSAYASNLHAINLCDKVKCRTVDTGVVQGWFGVRGALQRFAFPAVLHCSLDSCKVICDVVDLLCLISLSISFCLLFFHIIQIVGKYDLYALAKFVSVHEHAEIIYIDARNKINCCTISYI